jgi:single-strand DNA-binding protein
MNSVLLIGRLTKDPEVRYTAETQLAVARFSLAIDDGYGEKKRTNFPNIVAFGKTAESCEKFLSKGKLVAVQGKIQTGSYKNKEGATVYTTDVVADRVEFLEWGDKSESSTPKVQAGIPDGFQAIEDDDIPF